MRTYIQIRHIHRCNRHILAMRPEPKCEPQAHTLCCLGSRFGQVVEIVNIGCKMVGFVEPNCFHTALVRATLRVFNIVSNGYKHRGVAPSRGRGLKLGGGSNADLGSGGRPLTGAWIETGEGRGEGHPGEGVAPSRGRGLKRGSQSLRFAGAGGRPLTGAWIETGRTP